jgi:Na+:H+ antiporter
MNSSLQILLCIALIILVAKLTGALTARIGLPLVLGELLAGVFLGPTLLDIWSIPWLSHPSSADSVSVAAVFRVLAQIGVVLLMFIAGLETDVAMMRNAVAPAFWAATGGVVLPMLAGSVVARQLGFNWQEAIFIGTILTATSVTITAQTLMNLKQLRTKVGSTILGAAVIDDVLGLIVLSLVIAIAPQMTSGGSMSWHALVLTLTRMVICLVLFFWLGPPITRWMLRQASRLHGHHTEVAAALIIAFLLAFQAEWLGGMAAITGAYLGGLFVALTSARERVCQELHPMMHSLLGPIFFVSIGLDVNARRLEGTIVFFVLLLLIAVAGKIIGCGLGTLFSGFTRRESLVVGVGMIPRGEVGLITASLGLAAGLVSRDLYAQVVVLVLITTLITPPLLRFAFPKTETVATGSDGAAAHKDLSSSVADLIDA